MGSEGISVLVVDDEPTIRALVARIVERAGFRVEVARDGADAISKLEQQHYNVLVVDLMMPILDGYAVVEWVKEHADPKPAIIVVSAGDSAAVRRLDGSVVHSFIRKPFDVDVLSDLIAAAARINAEERPAGEVIPFPREGAC